MAKLLVHIYGLIPGDFKDVEMEFEGSISLERLELEIIDLYGQEIQPQYINGEGLMNHKYVISGDKLGKRVDYSNHDLSMLKEIWFIVPLAGG